MADDRKLSIWRHPRRLGFILFNLAALKLLTMWFEWRAAPIDPDVGGVLDTVLISAGMAVLVTVWVGMWVAWGVFLYLRHRRHKT
ncbi:hypothetical protein [Devosia sp.]|uniref:hypothetical protein n=1 Tax=Devosia sp. TaxID=1871048 RepID=UPI003A8E7F9E